MDLYQFYLTTQSVYAIVAIIFLVVFTIVLALIYAKVARISHKVEIMAQKGIETSEEIKSFTERMTGKIENFTQQLLSLENLSKVFTKALDTYKNYKKNKKE